MTIVLFVVVAVETTLENHFHPSSCDLKFIHYPFFRGRLLISTMEAIEAMDMKGGRLYLFNYSIIDMN